jgi:DNA-binding transcriptional regulator YiaG
LARFSVNLAAGTGSASAAQNTALAGQRLRQLRRQHGLSQEQLAAKAGISPQPWPG